MEYEKSAYEVTSQVDIELPKELLATSELGVVNRNLQIADIILSVVVH